MILPGLLFVLGGGVLIGFGLGFNLGKVDRAQYRMVCEWHHRAEQGWADEHQRRIKLMDALDEALTYRRAGSMPQDVLERLRAVMALERLEESRRAGA